MFRKRKASRWIGLLAGGAAAAATLLAALLAGSAVRPRPAAAQTAELTAAALDSIQAGLGSDDWNERYGALERVNRAFPGALPSTLVTPIIALLNREAASDPPEDDGYGEYIVELVRAGVHTKEARAVDPILRLDGLGVSSGVSAFVASYGHTVMPALDALARTREDRASDVVETYGFMYSHYGAKLTRADSVHVLSYFLSAAGHPSAAVRAQLARVAGEAPLPELVATLTEMAAVDPYRFPNGVYLVREEVNDVLPNLRRVQTSWSTATLIARASILTDAVCEDATGTLGGQCTALRAHLATAIRHVEAGRSQPAGNALDAYRRAVQKLESEGLIPHVSAVTLDGTAAAVAERL